MDQYVFEESGPPRRIRYDKNNSIGSKKYVIVKNFVADYYCEIINYWRESDYFEQNPKWQNFKNFDNDKIENFNFFLKNQMTRNLKFLIILIYNN